MGEPAVLRYLERAEEGLTDPWERDEYRLSWLTVLYASRGLPEARTASIRVNIAVEWALDLPPRRTPFEESLFYLQQNRRRAMYCPNPKCETPCFFATKKAQKYCSLACAQPAQREAKRQWWADNKAKRSSHAKRHHR